MGIYDRDWYRESTKKSPNIFVAPKKQKKPILFIILVLMIIGCLVYFGYLHPEYPVRIITYFKGLTKAEPLKPFTPMGTEENPFDWSTSEKQVASAPSLPKEGSTIYVRVASGQSRLVKKR
jgi:hypothetical protein